MKVERIISIGRIDQEEKEADLTSRLTPDQRVSLLEDLRKQVYTMVKHEYPRRLSRVLTVIKKRKS
jgi:hypothetical protein